MHVGGKVTFSEDLEERIRDLEATILSAPPDERGWIYHALGGAYSMRTEGPHADNIDRMIRCFEASLQVLGSEEMLLAWAITQYNIGIGYSDRLNGSGTDNLERAIGAYEASLTVLSRELTPIQWCMAKNSLGAAYAGRIRGVSKDNLEIAIGHLRDALDAYSSQPDASPVHVAIAKFNLGKAYSHRIDGDQRQNVDDAQHYLTGALDLVTREQAPSLWAEIHRHLVAVYIMLNIPDSASMVIVHAEAALEVYRNSDDVQEQRSLHRIAARAYLSNPPGDPAKNTRQAIRHLELAAEVTPAESLPSEWAAIHRHMGDIFATRFPEGRAESIELAITHYEQALSVCNRHSAPREWAQINMNLGPLHRRRLREDRPHNIERSISASLGAIEVFREIQDTFGMAGAEHNVGIAYRERIEGDKETNIDSAIAHLRAAREVCDADSSPGLWLRIMSSLGNAIRARSDGHNKSDVTEAIAIYEEALGKANKDDMPVEWSDLHVNLASSFEMLGKGDGEFDLERASAAYETALQVLPPSYRPVECLQAAARLGHLRSAAGRWDEAVDAYRIAIAAGRWLYGSAVAPTAREIELREIGMLQVRNEAAFAAARSGDFASAIMILEEGRARAMAEAVSLDSAVVGNPPEGDRYGVEFLRHASLQLRELESAEQAVDTIMSGDLIDYAIEQGVTDPEQQERARRLTRSALNQEIRRVRTAIEAARERLSDGARHELGSIGVVDWPTVCGAVEDGQPLAYLATTLLGTVVLLAYRVNGRDPQAEAIWADSFDQARLAGLLSFTNDWPPVAGLLPAILERPMIVRDALDALLPVVGREIAGPLSRRLSEIGAAGVILIPCGALGFIPFHAATCDDVAQHRLCDVVDVSYAPSARVLAAARRRLPSRQGSEIRLAGVGDPRPRSHPLPFASWELSSVASLFDQRIVLCGAEATKQALLEASQGASHVHLACHGYYKFGWSYESYVELAGDEYLTLRDILVDRPFADARIVVLAACQTAVVGADQAPDEAIGVATSFLRAGTAGVVGTLWQVDDFASALLMRLFYSYHTIGDPDTGEGSMPPARALRFAQRALASLTIEQVDDYVSEFNDFIAARYADTVDSNTAGALRQPGSQHLSAHPGSARPFAHARHWAAFVYHGA
jgi:CHAT domain-containing protein/tetratricopeptide (TPR) repeat protein